MKGEVTTETIITAPADAVWAAYRGKELGLLVDKLARDVIGKVEFVEGDGGVGTVIKLTFPPGTPGEVGYLKEVIKVNDDEKRIKVTEVIEGGFRALGFDLYRIRIQILENETVSSTVRSSIEYEVDDSLAELASLVTADVLELIAQIISRHLLEAK